MLTFLRRLFKLVLFLAFVGVLFVGLMFWAKFWGVYCIPPSEKNPEGVTLIVSREEDEPMLSASDRPIPKKDEEEDQPPRRRSMYEGTPRQKPPIEKRIIFKLPFIEYVYEQTKVKPEKK